MRKHWSLLRNKDAGSKACQRLCGSAPGSAPGSASMLTAEQLQRACSSTGSDTRRDTLTAALCGDEA